MTTRIDRETLIDALTDIVSDLTDIELNADYIRVSEEIGAVNPVLVYDSTTGRFSIQSSLTPTDDAERAISGQLDTNCGLGTFLGDLTADEVPGFVQGMTDEYIAEYIIGDTEG